MSDKQPGGQRSDQIEAGIARLYQELNREDSQLRSCLLDAAIAGLRLTRSPESLDLRRDAAQIWAVIEPILSHHLEAEDTKLIPWLNQRQPLSRETRRRIQRSHSRLRTLIAMIGQANADRLVTAHARDAGRALVNLVMDLDDAIDDEERRLFPALRKALFAIRGHSSAS
ncbi:MAG: hemerythrin domain-containing protein [Deltaproteobacteria bacterium]|nr:hemerythrin domain-containing protein [Deltaproteobacteria bacterium]